MTSVTDKLPSPSSHPDNGRGGCLRQEDPGGHAARLRGEQQRLAGHATMLTGSPKKCFFFKIEGGGCEIQIFRTKLFMVLKEVKKPVMILKCKKNKMKIPRAGGGF